MTMNSLSAAASNLNTASALSSQSLPQSTPFDLSDPHTVIRQLKTTVNSVIGSRTKKSHLVNNGMVQQYVQLLRINLDDSPHAPEIISLSSTIIASLANTPAYQTLLLLLRSGAHDALVECLQRLATYLSQSGRSILELQHAPESSSSSNSVQWNGLKLLESLLRAIRSILLSIADQLSASPRWGIGSAWGTKAVSTGVSITSVNPSAGGTKMFGKSSRDAIKCKAFGLENRKEKHNQQLQDVLMASVSSDNLKSKAQNSVRHSEQEEKNELRTLSRRFLTKIYSTRYLGLILGPLFICRAPQQSTQFSKSTTTIPALRVSEGKASNDSVPSDDHDPMACSIQFPPAAFTINVENLPMATRSKLLSIIEMICAIISSTIFIPGIGSFELEEPVQGYQDIKSPEAENQRRRELVLDFVASQSPFTKTSDDEPQQETEPRDRTKSQANEADYVDLEAEPIRKGSRSRSKMHDSIHSGSSEAEHLPLWEQESNVAADTNLQPHNVLSVLLASSECGFAKTQEAALWCLAELTRESPDAAIRLFRSSTPSGQLPTSMLLNLRKSASANVRLAGFCCLAHITKVHPFTSITNQCVLEVLMEYVDQRSSTASCDIHSLQSQNQVQMQVQAAFGLARLVADDVDLQTLAVYEYGALEKFISLLDRACTSTNRRPNTDKPFSLRSALPNPSLADPTMGVAPPAVDEGSIRLREACLTALASLTFQRDELRRKLVDSVTPPVLSMVVPSLSFPALGVRVAACRLVRALSRSVSILRTSIVDAGVAQQLLALLTDQEEEEVVKVEATAAICNLVLNFSPMKKLVSELGGVDQLVGLVHGGWSHSSESTYVDTISSTSSRTMGLSGSQQLRLNALWALKNVLSSSESWVKVEIMEKLGWNFLSTLISEGELVLREQALNILRNVASSQKQDISLAVKGVGGQEKFIDLLEKVIWDCRDAGEQGACVVEQVAYCMVNLATGTDAHRLMILRRPNLMDALAYFLNHPWKDIRVAGAWCAMNLMWGVPDDSETDVSMEAVTRLGHFEIIQRLKDLANNDTELDVRDRAKAAVSKYHHLCGLGGGGVNGNNSVTGEGSGST